MGLDVVMLGKEALVGMKADRTSEPELALVVGFCVRNIPEAAKIDVKEISELVRDGHRVGNYSDLHILRGLAVTRESAPAALESKSESDLNSAIESFYQQENQTTGYRHLINHADDSGFYVPLELPEPIAIEGIPPGEDEKVTLSLGSSPALLRELDVLNEVLGLPGDIGDLGEEEFVRVTESHRWPVAAYVWGVLHLYARESVATSSFIQFC
jgi:hypothetical protein